MERQELRRIAKETIEITQRECNRISSRGRNQYLVKYRWKQTS